MPAESGDATGPISVEMRKKLKEENHDGRPV